MAQDLFSCLKSFLAVAEDKSFAGAARRSKTSSPVLTKQIQWLEKYVRKKLFERTTRYVRLTEAGELYLDHAKKILADEQAAKHALSDIDGEPHGQITIGIPTKLNAVCIAKNLALFLTRYPKIKCRIISDNTPAAAIAGLADIVICPLKTIDSQLVKNCLFTASTGIFASPNYIEKYGIPNSLQEVSQHNCLINLTVSPNKIWKFANGQKIQVCGNYESDLGNDITTAALHGIGLGYLVKVLIQKEIDAGELVEINLGYEPIPVTLYLYHRPIASSSITRLLVDCLMQSMQKKSCNG
jgi:DNA-binding transcriptional LysR family regulator